MLLKPVIIAEIGCNHLGEIDIAEKMISVAANFCNVDVVKFQKCTPKELLSPTEFNAPHPVPENSYGPTYGAHREYLDLTVAQHERLKNCAEKANVIYSSSVWDMNSAKDIVSLNPKLIKVPSACNLHFDMLKYICDEFAGDIHLSLGMTYREEEERIVAFFQKQNREKSLVLYACTSGYPVPFKDVSLIEISRIKETYGEAIKAIGFSGHHLGIAVDIAALTLGATYIERHFTLDRTLKGTDHAASLEPDGMRKLARDLRNVSQSLTSKAQEVLEIEENQRKKLKRIK